MLLSSSSSSSSYFLSYSFVLSFIPSARLLADMVYVGTSVLWGPRYGGVLVSFRGRLTILGGIVAGKVASKSIYTSPDDGHNWVPASTLLPMAMFNMVTAVYEGHLFLIGGYTRGEDMVYRDMHAVISTTDLSRWHNHDSIGTTAAGAQLVVHQWLGRMALILVVLEQDPLGTVHPLDDNQVTPPVPGLYVSVLPSTVTVTTKITLNWTRFPLYPFIFAEEKGPSSFCLYSQAGNLYLSGLPADRAIFNTTSRSLVYARELYEQATSFRIPQPGKCPGVILNDYVERTVIVNGSYTFVDDFSNATAPEIVTLTGAMYPGAVVNLTCPDGLHSIGAQTVTCLEVADAQPPKEDEPGVVYQNYLVERTIPYRDMTKLRYVWDKDPGSTYCTPSTCSRIVIHEVFGKVTYYPDKYGPTGFRARAVVECEPGYHLTGSREQLCGSNGQWQGEPPDCVDMCARDPSPCPEDTYCVPTVYRDKETYVCVPKRIDSVYSTDPQFEHVQLDGLPAADDVAFTSAPGLKIYNARDVSASYNMTFKLPQTKVCPIVYVSSSMLLRVYVPCRHYRHIIIQFMHYHFNDDVVAASSVFPSFLPSFALRCVTMLSFVLLCLPARLSSLLILSPLPSLPFPSSWSSFSSPPFPSLPFPSPPFPSLPLPSLPFLLVFLLSISILCSDQRAHPPQGTATQGSSVAQ